MYTKEFEITLTDDDGACDGAYAAYGTHARDTLRARQRPCPHPPASASSWGRPEPRNTYGIAHHWLRSESASPTCVRSSEYLERLPVVRSEGARRAGLALGESCEVRTGCP